MLLVKLEACIQRGVTELVTAAGVWLFPRTPLIGVRHPLLWAGIEPFGREQMSDFFLCLAEVANGQCEEIGVYL